MTQIPLHIRNYQYTLGNYQSTHKTQKITKIPPKPKKGPKYARNLKMTKIPPKPKKLSKYLQNLKTIKIPQKLKKKKMIFETSTML